MIFKKFFLLFFLLIFNRAPSSDNFFQNKLTDLDNKIISFSDFKTKKAVAVIFLLSDCPASQSYTLTLNKLAKKYSQKNIEFIGVFPGTFSTDDELKNFRKEYKISFPLLKDPEMKLTKELKATIGPSCFLINEDGNIVYKGRIDNWLFALGKKRQEVTENNLDDAIDACINNKPVKVSETNAIGCILEYDKK